MVNARQLYNTLARMTELGGFKNVSEFFTQPPEGLELPKPPAPPPPYQVAIAQMQIQAQATEKNLDRQMEMAKLELSARQKREEAILQNNVQMANDERDARRAMAEADTNDQIKALEATIAKYKVDQDNETRIIVAEIQAGAAAARAAGQDENAGAKPTTKPGSTTDMQPVLDALAAIYESQNAPVEMVRHPESGEILGVRRGTGPVRPVKRNPTTGGIEGLQ